MDICKNSLPATIKHKNSSWLVLKQRFMYYQKTLSFVPLPSAPFNPYYNYKSQPFSAVTLYRVSLFAASPPSPAASPYPSPQATATSQVVSIFDRYQYPLLLRHCHLRSGLRVSIPSQRYRCTHIFYRANHEQTLSPPSLQPVCPIFWHLARITSLQFLNEPCIDKLFRKHRRSSRICEIWHFSEAARITFQLMPPSAIFTETFTIATISKFPGQLAVECCGNV